MSTTCEVSDETDAEAPGSLAPPAWGEGRRSFVSIEALT